jgi:hypothetical protein
MERIRKAMKWRSFPILNTYISSYVVLGKLGIGKRDERCGGFRRGGQ